jgi:hypothetical protein
MARTTNRAVASSRRNDSKRGGPLAGWAWRDARCAIQFGKRQGAWAVDFRADRVRYFLGGPAFQVQGKKQVERRDARHDGVQPPRQPSPPADGAPPPPSKRAQKSLERLQEFQQHKRIRLRWQRALRKVARRWRHQRMWDVHNAWYATLPAPADAAGPPAPETERMDDDGGSNRAASHAGISDGTAAVSTAHEPSPPPLQGLDMLPSGGGLNPAAQAFVPVQQTAEVEHMQLTEAHEMAAARKRIRRQEVALRKELRAGRKATRAAAAAAEAATAAKRNAEQVLRAQALRSEGRLRPLGVQRPPPG